MGYKVDSTFESLHKILNGEHEITAVDYYFPVVRFRLRESNTERKDNCTILCFGLQPRFKL